MSDQKNNGGPAFPVPGFATMGGDVYHGEEGMTLRDYFAAKAMVGLLSSANVIGAISRAAGMERKSPAEKSAEIAYQTADAMLAERAK